MNSPGCFSVIISFSYYLTFSYSFSQITFLRTTQEEGLDNLFPRMTFLSPKGTLYSRIYPEEVLGVNKGRLLLEVQPPTLLNTIFDRKLSPFVYLALTNGTPFTQPSVESGIPF